MARPQRLDEGEILEGLTSRPGWTFEKGKLYRSFEFRDFAQAFGFMSSMALFSEARDHHPEWFNVYRRVEIHLATHDAGGVTELDLEWAAAADEAASRFAQ